VGVTHPIAETLSIARKHNNSSPACPREGGEGGGGREEGVAAENAFVMRQCQKEENHLTRSCKQIILLTEKPLQFPTLGHSIESSCLSW
jgi:hypothetical protein